MADAMAKHAARTAGRDDDHLLVERCRRGDRGAFDALVAAHRDRVAATAHRLLGWSDDAEDVVQEVFLKALTHLSRFRGEAKLSTWLTTITIHACRSHQRSASRWLRKLSGLADRQPQRAEPPARLPDEDAETFETVRRAVAALPPKYREVIVLRYLEGMSVLDIAGVLNAPTNTVEVRLSRARQKLKGPLAELLKD